MKALVLGGNGFIGSHVVDALLASGYEVRVFDRVPEKFRQPLKGVDYRFGSFSDAFLITEALEGVDTVFHLISTTVPSTSNFNASADISDNLIPTVNLIETMMKMGICRIIYLSSGGTVYGNPMKVPVEESHPLRPLCSYGIVKVSIEHYLQMYQHLYGLSPIILRPSNPYGPRQGHFGIQGLIGTFLGKIVRNEPLKVWGDGSVIRDYIYVTDLARLCVEAARAGGTGTFNAGAGIGYSVREIVEIISEETGANPEVIYEPGRPFDVKQVVLDIDAARRAFGWIPVVDIREGVRNSWQWIQAHN